jgi:ABC-2 type transport system permease protein
MIKNKEADLMITIPDDFSESYNRFLTDSSTLISPIVNYGDPSNARYMLAASYVDYLTYIYIGEKTGISVPFSVSYQFAGVTRNLSDFDIYLPALLVLSVIMMLFTAGASIVREVEKDTITRLSLSKVSSGGFMFAMSINQVIIGLVCMFLTLLAAFSVGYRTTGSVPLLLLVGTLTCFSVISISIITASFIRTMFGLLTLGCFPFFILMFFSDCMIPLPKIHILTLAGNALYLNDILPTATATRALNKIMNYNSGLGDISFELIWITFLSIIYFIAGVRLFRRKYGY